VGEYNLRLSAVDRLGNKREALAKIVVQNKEYKGYAGVMISRLGYSWD